jgi:hypothetical protein
MTVDEIKAAAGALARDLETGPMTPDLRARFIAVRSAIIRRGVFDPVLMRFDTATVPPASQSEVARQLAEIAQSLR